MYIIAYTCYRHAHLIIYFNPIHIYWYQPINQLWLCRVAVYISPSPR